MNEFTKEELKEILWHITTKASMKPGNDLVPKIQDMVENYCEHEWREGSMGTIYCKQCKQRINFKMQ